MSNEKKATAGDVLFQRVYLPSFVKAASAQGHAPKSDDELVSQLKIAAYLRAYEQKTQKQQAETGSNKVKEAAQRLEQYVGPQVSSQAPQGVMEDNEVNAALSQMCSN